MGISKLGNETRNVRSEAMSLDPLEVWELKPVKGTSIEVLVLDTLGTSVQPRIKSSEDATLDILIYEYGAGQTSLWYGVNARYSSPRRIALSDSAFLTVENTHTTTAYGFYISYEVIPNVE